MHSIPVFESVRHLVLPYGLSSRYQSHPSWLDFPWVTRNTITWDQEYLCQNKMASKCWNHLASWSIPEELTGLAIMSWMCSLQMGRRSGLMVRMLNSRSSGPGSGPGRGIVLCFWARHFTLTAPLPTQVYKWVPAKMVGVTLRWTSIPSRGEWN